MHPVPGSTQPGLSIGALAYDAIAAGYDAQVQGDDWMRAALHGHYTRVFQPGQRVLDVGCGTGIDAVFLARRGIRVTAIDYSPEMIAQLHARVSSTGVTDLVDARVLPVEGVSQLRRRDFDGLISAFAGLNTLPDLTQFARDAAALVRPHARMILHLLNRFSLWEWLGYLSHANWSAARQVGRRRTREFTIGGRPVPHTVYFAREAYRRFFQTDFALRALYSLGSLRPPHTVRRLPYRLVQQLERLDVRAGHWPLLRDAGRFCVLDLERMPT